MTSADSVKLCSFIKSVWPGTPDSAMREAACREVLADFTYADGMTGIRLLASERVREFPPTFFEIVLAVKRHVAPWLGDSYEVAKAGSTLTYRESVRRYELGDGRLYNSRVASPQSDGADARDRRIRGVFEALMEEARQMSLQELSVRTDLHGLRIKGRTDTEKRRVADNRAQAVRACAEADYAAGNTSDDSEDTKHYQKSGSHYVRATAAFKREYVEAYGSLKVGSTTTRARRLPPLDVIRMIDGVIAENGGMTRDYLMMALWPTRLRLAARLGLPHASRAVVAAITAGQKGGD